MKLAFDLALPPLLKENKQQKKLPYLPGGGSPIQKETNSSSLNKLTRKAAERGV